MAFTKLFCCCSWEACTTYYINYKWFFIIALLGLVDYDYRFLFADVGCQGCITHGGVFRNFNLYGALVCNKLNLSLPTKVRPLNPRGNSTELLPFVFVRDDAFPLTNFYMKHYHLIGLIEGERLFNFWLSHVRGISRYTLGIWKIDSVNFQQEFACKLKKLHHAP